MKLKLNFLALLIIGLFSVKPVMANTEYHGLDYSMAGVEAGFNWNTMDFTNSTSNKSVLGFQLGGTAVINFNPMFGLKTGLYYVQKPFENSITAGKVYGKLTYASIPLFFMLKFEDYAGVYVGPSLNMLLSDEVTSDASSSYSLTDKKAMVIPITVGGQFKFSPMLAVNIFYEMASGDLAKDLSNSRAFGAGLLITFD